MTERPQFRYQQNVPSEAETQGMGGCLTRLAWVMAAPVALLALGVSLARNGSGAWSIESALYWAVVAVAITMRYLDIFRYQGETTQGKPASREDWRRYSLGLPAVALAAWSAALFLGEE